MSLHTDLQSFMVAMNPDMQMKYGTDPERAILCDAPTMTVIKIAYGDTAAEQWLVPQLTDLCLYCGVKELLSPRQYEQLASIITNEFGFLKTSEVLLFFYRFKTGRYGRFYGAVDPMIITQAIRDRFMPERARVLDAEESRIHAEEVEQHRKQCITLEEYRRRTNQC